MISWTPVETALYNWLVPAYVPRAIFANQRAPMPAFPFASLLLTASSREGGRDQFVGTTDVTRAQSIRVTPNPDRFCWSKSSAAGSSTIFNGLAYGAGLYVAVGVQSSVGCIYTSPDGVVWTQRTPAYSTFSIRAVIYAGGQFVAVGFGAKIQTSPDGIVWSPSPMAGANNLFSIAYGGGIYAVGGGGEIYTSPDGVVWTRRVTSLPVALTCMCYGNGQFVAGGTEQYVYTSPDGVVWTRQAPSGSGIRIIRSMVYAMGVFVGVGDSASIWVSPDGISWASYTAGGGYTNVLYSVTYDSGLFVAGGLSAEIQTSVDGVTWVRASAGSVPYTITVNGTPYTYTVPRNPYSTGIITVGAVGPTGVAMAGEAGVFFLPVVAAQITAGLKTAMAAAPQTVTDNVGTLDISYASVFNIVVTANLTWANRDYGHEVDLSVRGSRRLAYSITVHVDEANMVPGGAYAWAESIRTSLSLESVVSALWAQGIAIVRDMGVKDISMMTNGQWVSRAVLDVVFRTVVQPLETTGYIAHATATGDVDGETVIVEMP